jgi:hypothetical protein
MSIVQTILLSALISFLILGSAAGLIIGTTLILRPLWLLRLNQICNRWISTRHVDKFLETTIYIDSWFYRYRRSSALLTSAGAIYMLYYFGVQIDKVSVVSGLAKRFHIPVAYFSVFFEPMVLIMLLGSAFALFISLFLLIRPSRFLKFEHDANKWVSLRHAMKPLEAMRDNVDAFTFRHSQQVGGTLVLGSIYTLALFTFWA